MINGIEHNTPDIRFFYVDNGPTFQGWEWHDVNDGEAMSEGLFNTIEDCRADSIIYLGEI
jgi:hypothetical protein